MPSATSLPRWKSRAQTRASAQGAAQPRAAREQRTPFRGCTTNVLTNGPITCEPNCCRRRSFSSHRLRSQICSIRLRVTSITTEPVHTLSRVMANNAALDNALDEMAQNTAKQEPSVFFASQRARQCMASLNGTGVLPGSTGPVARYLGPHLDIMGSIRLELERRRAAAFRTWTRFRPVWFRAVPLRVRRLFFRALVVSILYTDLESLRLRSPDYEYLDRFILGLGRKMMRGKATISTKLEDGTEKKTHSRQKTGVGLPWPGTISHGTSRSSLSMVPEPYEGPHGSPERLVLLFW